MSSKTRLCLANNKTAHNVCGFFGHWFLIIFLITHLVPLFSNRRQILYSYYHQNWAAHTNVTVTTGCKNLILGWTFPLFLALRLSISAYSCTLTHLWLTLLLTPPEKNLKKQKPNHKTMMTPVTSLWHIDCYLTPWRSREDILQLFSQDKSEKWWENWAVWWNI